MAPPSADRPLTGAILAGGEGRRMGLDKAAMLLGRHTMLDRTAATLASVADVLLLVMRDGQPLPTLEVPVPRRIVRDRVPGAGPLGGLDAALAACPSDLLLVLAVDMPLVSAEVLRLILATAEADPRADAVILDSPRGLQPFPGAYRSRVGATVAELLGGGHRRLADLLERVVVHAIPEARWRAVDPGGRSVTNLNRPGDIARLQPS